MLITSVNNEKIKEIVKLKDKKYRDKMGLFCVEGKDMVDIAYEKGIIDTLLILEGTENNYQIPVTYVSMNVMKKISDMNSVSKYFCVCKKIDKSDIGNRLIILDGIQDPGNLGTIIRSAVAFNFDTVILSLDTVDVYNPKVLRSTKGMIFNINIKCAELPQLIDGLSDYTIYGTDVYNGVNIKNEELPLKIALVIGNEGNGISEMVKSRCNKFVYIDMNDKCESLNASVAASILMYEVNGR